MIHHLLLAQDSVKRRLAGNILASVSQAAHDLPGAHIAELGAGGDIDYLCSLLGCECMSTPAIGPLASVIALRLFSPTLNGPLADAQRAAGLGKSSAL
jgi:hypothetical protein